MITKSPFQLLQFKPLFPTNGADWKILLFLGTKQLPWGTADSVQVRHPGGTQQHFHGPPVGGGSGQCHWFHVLSLCIVHL